MHSSLPNRAQSDRSTVVVHPVSSTAHNQSQVQVPPPLLSRLPRIPIGLFISILVVLCSVACGIIAFLVIYFPADSLAEKALRDFTDAVATVTAEKVQRRFDIFRSVAEDAVRVLGRTHAYTKLDANVNASLSYDGLGADVSPLPLSDTLLWFARTLDATGLILVLYHSLVDGLIISPYSIFDAVHFARRPGLITVANTTIASRTSFVESGYFRLDDFHPENTTQPFVRNYFNRYVVEARPYTPVFQESGFALRWSPIYVGVLQRTSSIGLGASWGTAGGTNVSARSTFGFHGYTADVVAFFQTLTIGKTGAAILIDVASRAFVGGNIADDSTRFVTTTMTNTTSNISTTTTTPQLVLMEELQDSRVAPVVNAAGFDAINESTGALVYGNRLLTCTFDHVDSNGINGPAANGTATACLFVFNPSTSILKEMDHFSFSLLTDEVQIIHVSAVQDEYGLDMRLILIIPTDDFVGSMRRGAVRSLAIASSVILFMVVIVACLSHVWLLNPLKDMAKVLKKAVGRNEPKETYKPRPVDGTRADTPPLSSTVDQQRHAPQANVFEQVAGTPTCSSSLQTDPSSRTLGAGALYLRPKLMQADVERINAHGITELITIRSGILKLISALEVVGLFLPQADQKAAALIAISTSSSTPKVSSTSLPHLVTGGGGDEDDPSYFRDDLSSLVGRTRNSILNTVPHGGGAGGGAHHHHSGVAGGGRVSFGGAFLTAVPYNTAGQLYSVLVTTIVANFVGLDTVRHATKQLPSTFSAIHTEYLRVVMDACTSHGGTVDLFYGDRIWAHFNAERRLPGHALKACRAMLAIEDEVELVCQRCSSVTTSSSVQAPATILVHDGDNHTEMATVGPLSMPSDEVAAAGGSSVVEALAASGGGSGAVKKLLDGVAVAGGSSVVKALAAGGGGSSGAVEKLLGADINDIWKSGKYRLRVRLGAATSESICGVMGSSSVKRFTVVGPCVLQAAFLCAGAGEQRVNPGNPAGSAGLSSVVSSDNEPQVSSRRNALGSGVSTADGDGGGGAYFSPLPFSSLVAPKTVELATIRGGATSGGGGGHVGAKTMLFRHVRISCLPYDAPTQQSVVSTPVLGGRLRYEYPRYIASTDVAAFQRMKIVNLLFEHMAAGDMNAAMDMLKSLPHWKDEWLLQPMQHHHHA
ncbi:adenylate cyclase, putative [Bodo saltans]|uniref:Adenylate cyclase, putative n=1 Tax=Bodo saltans TaxID=75058 RepID=A0A0S4JNC2_BODSA|nr:adenylate cyclase, putative [Bodo saltans]|eukprot:CUG92149.1 adenylate cyclase, putative [Bodo saltans]